MNTKKKNKSNYFYIVKWVLSLVLTLFFFNSNILFAKKANNNVLSFSGKAKVIDGDSIFIINKNNKYEVRLFGINAPEYKTKNGKIAKYALKNYLKKNPHTECHVVNIDKYKRYVSTCYNKKKDIALYMLEKGHARVFRKWIKTATKSFQKKYYQTEKNAEKLYPNPFE